MAHAEMCRVLHSTLQSVSVWNGTNGVIILDCVWVAECLAAILLISVGGGGGGREGQTRRKCWAEVAN